MSTELVKGKPVENGGKAVREEFVQPRFRIVPGQEAYKMEVSMPGVSRNGIDVSLVEDALTIVGRRDRRVPEGWRPLFVELGDYDYRLRVRLNIKVDQEAIEAHMQDGLLRLTLPIACEAKPRRIEIH